MFTLLHEGLPVDKHMIVTRTCLDVTSGTARKVMLVLG